MPHYIVTFWLALFGVGMTPLNVNATEIEDLQRSVEQLVRAEKYADALPLAEKYADAIKQASGEQSVRYADALYHVGVIYHRLYRYDEAERLYKRVIAIREAFDPNDPAIAQLIPTIGLLYSPQVRNAEAEPLFKRALKIREKVYGLDHPFVANDLSRLALLYHSQWRYAEAEPLYQRAISILEKITPQHPNLAATLSGLAGLYDAQARYREAEPLHKRALAIIENALGSEHLSAAVARGYLSTHYHLQGRYAESEVLLKQNLRFYESAFGAENQTVAVTVHNMASLYAAQGRYTEAEPLYKYALSIAEKVHGPRHPFVARNHFKLAELYYAQNLWAEALDHARQAVEIAMERAKNASQIQDRGATDTTPFELQQNSYSFSWLIRAAWQVTQKHTAEQEHLAAEAFTAAQLIGRTSAALALSQMAARFAKGEGALSALVREQQNLSAAWQQIDKELVVMHAGPSEIRSTDRQRTLESHLSDVDGRLMSVNARLAKDYPEYAALFNPTPLPISGVQRRLQADEVLIQIVFAGSEGFAWAVTNTGVRWAQLRLGPKDITQRVSALRCGLDASNWVDPHDWPRNNYLDRQRRDWQASRREECRQLLGVDVSERDFPPFNLMISFELHKALIEPFADIVIGKKLLLVLPGQLAKLPFHVLVDREPKISIPKRISEYRDVAWLARSHAIAVLPSVASLRDLRERPEVRPAPRAYIGFGNPLLEGDSRNRDDVRRARKARQTQSCAHTAPTLSQMMLSIPGLRGESVNLFGDRLPDIERIRHQSPLPETADEICAVARDLGASPNDVYLAATATEKTVKSLSAAGSLADARVVHFATHAFLADELVWLVHGRAEPALILTPPPRDTAPEGLDVDDGLLTASEVAKLKLNADWVVLSACNTAGGARQSGEALSGLARAFFYAGARALLVSHWYVNSEAAVKLTTGTFSQIKAHPKIGRAEALGRAMRSIFENGSNFALHPAYWAPFVVVGEGAQ
jgi:CHAT domain-containing protein/tetratricopeptide (TPR) repeat protein